MQVQFQCFFCFWKFSRIVSALSCGLKVVQVPQASQASQAPATNAQAGPNLIVKRSSTLKRDLEDPNRSGWKSWRTNHYKLILFIPPFMIAVDRGFMTVYDYVTQKKKFSWCHHLDIDIPRWVSLCWTFSWRSWFTRSESDRCFWQGTGKHRGLHTKDKCSKCTNCAKFIACQRRQLGKMWKNIDDIRSGEDFQDSGCTNERHTLMKVICSDVASKFKTKLRQLCGRASKRKTHWQADKCRQHRWLVEKRTFSSVMLGRKCMDMSDMIVVLRYEALPHFA